MGKSLKLKAPHNFKLWPVIHTLICSFLKYSRMIMVHTMLMYPTKWEKFAAKAYYRWKKKSNKQFLLNLRQNAKGNHCSCSIHHEDQDHCSTREKILCLDRRFHPCFPLHIPSHVDHQARLRRSWSIHRPQKMLLIFSFRYIFSYLNHKTQIVVNITFPTF